MTPDRKEQLLKYIVGKPQVDVNILDANGTTPQILIIKSLPGIDALSALLLRADLNINQQASGPIFSHLI